MRVDDSRIRKEKVADSKISGYVWTGSKTSRQQNVSLEFTVPEALTEWFSRVTEHSSVFRSNDSP